MGTTFAQVAREVAGRHAPTSPIDSALEALGAKADHLVDELDVERKLQLATQFVRGLRTVGVADAQRIEHELFAALGATPTARRSVVIKDAISLITVRNHVGQLATALGMAWSAGMQVQSAVSDVARFVSTTGGGKIETEAMDGGRIHFEVWTNRAIGPVSMGAATPPWLIGVAKLAEGFRSRPAGAGAHLEFWIVAPREALVA